MIKLILYSFLTLSLAMTSCDRSPKPSLAEFSVVEYEPQYASGFKIFKTKDSKSSLLRIYNPWQGAGDKEQTLFIQRNNEPIPNGFTGQSVKGPVRRVVCMSSSNVAMFEAIGEIRRVVGVSGIDYISNNHINEHKRCGEVRDIGYDTSINFETLISIDPDIVLLYGVSGENTIITGKLSELDIPYMYVGDYTEQLPLGKCEWMMAMAELTDKQEHTQRLFSGIATRYNNLKAEVAKDPSNIKVMLNTPYRDVWFMPTTKSYMVRLIEDAGGDYIYKENNTDTTLPIDIEQAYLLAHQSDLWLNVGALDSMNELKRQNPKFKDIPIVLAGMVYNNNRQQTAKGGSNFWETGVVSPDVILQDLVTIFSKSDSTDLSYYKKLK